MVANVHIEYSTYQFSKESKRGWNPSPHLPPGPCGTEKSVVLRGLTVVSIENSKTNCFMDSCYKLIGLNSKKFFL